MTLPHEFMDRSDPMCVLYELDASSGEWVEQARTEGIKDNHNPEFITKIEMEVCAISPV